MFRRLAKRSSVDLIFSTVASGVVHKFVVVACYQSVKDGLVVLGVPETGVDLAISVAVVVLAAIIFMILRFIVAREKEQGIWAFTAIAACVCAGLAASGWHYIKARYLGDPLAFTVYPFLVDWAIVTWAVHAPLVIVRQAGNLARVRDMEKFVHGALWYVYGSGLTALNREEVRKIDSERDFELHCRREIDDILVLCEKFARAVRKGSVPEDTRIWASVYTLDGAKLVRHAPQTLGNRDLDERTREIERGFALWVFDEEGTRRELEKNPRPWETTDFVFRENLDEDCEHQDAQGWLPARSAIGIRVSIYNRPIGVLVVASDREGTLKEMDVVPLAIMGHYITMAYCHTGIFCPWHRRGWRDRIDSATPLVGERRLTFRTCAYSRDAFSALCKKPNVLEGQGEEVVRLLRSEYERRFQDISENSDRITRVYLEGWFNGWGREHLALEPDQDRKTWSINLHLPKGKYEYLYRVEYKDGQGGIREVLVFDPTREALKIDRGSWALNSVVRFD